MTGGRPGSPRCSAPGTRRGREHRYVSVIGLLPGRGKGGYSDACTFSILVRLGSASYFAVVERGPPLSFPRFGPRSRWGPA